VSDPHPPGDPERDPERDPAHDSGADEPTRPIAGWTPPSHPAPHGPSPIPRQHTERPPQQRVPGPHATPYGGHPAVGRPTAASGPHPMPPSGPPGGPWFAPPGQPVRPGDAPSRVPGWVWPAVAALALVVGLLGGAVGAVVVTGIDDQQPGEVSGGLGAVETQESAPLRPDNGSVSAVADALLPSTVQILASYEGEDAGATGSGFVLDRQGHIVTNNHVVSQAAEEEGPIKVVDHEGRQYDARVVGRSAVYDLAILYSADAKGLAPAALGASERLDVGDAVVAFGAPLGLSQTVTSGIVSALDRPVTTVEAENESSYINAVQTDAAINPGNSGGPLVNLAGEVVGVNSAIATTGGGLGGGGSGNIGVGFAIPIEQVRVTADQILRSGEARYPVIGAQVRIGGTSLAGARITEVMPDTPADQAGLAEDDLVTAVNGERVTDGIALIVAIRTHQPGETIEFTVVRGGQERRVELTLDGEVG
jgi:putative serine protease PepD